MCLISHGFVTQSKWAPTTYTDLAQSMVCFNAFITLDLGVPIQYSYIQYETYTWYVQRGYLLWFNSNNFFLINSKKNPIRCTVHTFQVLHCSTIFPQCHQSNCITDESMRKGPHFLAMFFRLNEQLNSSNNGDQISTRIANSIFWYAILLTRCTVNYCTITGKACFILFCFDTFFL